MWGTLVRADQREECAKPKTHHEVVAARAGRFLLLAVLFEALGLLLVHLGADEEEHVSVGFLQGGAGLGYLVDGGEDARLVELRGACGGVELVFLVLERLVALEDAAFVGVEDVVHLFLLFGAQAETLGEALVVPPAAGRGELQAAVHGAAGAVGSGGARGWRAGDVHAVGRAHARATGHTTAGAAAGHAATGRTSAGAAVLGEGGEGQGEGECEGCDAESRRGQSILDSAGVFCEKDGCWRDGCEEASGSAAMPYSAAGDGTGRLISRVT